MGADSEHYIGSPVRDVREEAKRKVFTQDPQCGFHIYFRLWVAGNNNFSWCVGWVPLPFQEALGSPFSPKSHSF